MNRVTLKGNVGRDPEIWLTQDGREMATFYLATNTSWKDESGEWQTCTEWHRITVFRKGTVGWIKSILKKGDTVYVEGKLSYHKRIDKYNQSHLTACIVIADYEGRVEHLRHRKVVDSDNPQNLIFPRDESQEEGLLYEDGDQTPLSHESTENYLQIQHAQ